jgi:aspartyl-tRNA synthetase
MMGAPAPVEPARLKELHIRPDLPPRKGGERDAAGGKAS